MTTLPVEQLAQDLFQVAIKLHQAGRLGQAINCYRQAANLAPATAAIHNMLGLALQTAGKAEEAVACIRRALELRPDYADAHNNLGIALMDLRRPQEAEACYRHALALNPDAVNALSNLGNSLQVQGRPADAIPLYQQAIQKKPDYADAHNNMGLALHALERFDEAVTIYRKAITIKPDYAEAYYNLGNSLQSLKRYDEALAAYARALAIRPGYAEAHNNTGVALIELNRVEEAIQAIERTLPLRPGAAEPHNQIAAALLLMNRPAEALAKIATAMAIKPDAPDTHWNRSLCLLLMGEFEEGWAEYEWRHHTEQGKRHRRNFASPRWGGEDLVGRRILLHAEQGFGDSLHFLRYVPLVAARGGRVILELQAPLVELARASFPEVEAVVTPTPAPESDVHCALLSLPHVFRTTLDTIPARVPYLRAPPDRIEHWAGMLGPARRPRVGLVWSGNPGQKNDRNRSMPLARLAPLAALPRIDFFSLQKDPRAEDAELLKSLAAVRPLGAELGDFADTAAVMSLMDLVVTVDTSTAHLAGALGRPTWVLLSRYACWRYLLDREDSPWYPTMRLLRQPAIGDWDAVVAQAARDMPAFLARAAVPALT